MLHGRGTSLVFALLFLSMSLPHGVSGTEDSGVWLCRAGQEASLAGKGHLLSQTLSAELRTLFSGTLGGSKLSREEWLCTRDGTGGAELHPSQENNPVDPTAKKRQGRASATMGKVGETKARKGKTQMRSWEENINSCFKQHIQLSHKGLKCYRGQGARSERQMGAMKPH